MNEQTIKNMLNTLAEFHAQKDSIDAQKAAMLEEVKIPTEIQNVVKEGTRLISALSDEFQGKSKAIEAEASALLSGVKIPDEVREIMAKIDAERDAIQKKASEQKALEYSRIKERESAIRAEIDAETKAIFDAVAQRRADIEAEFSGKLSAVNANIAKLEKEIKDATKEHGASVKGDFFHAVYVSGRVTWATEKMDGILSGLTALCESMPVLTGLVTEMKKSRKQGEPSITLRKS